MYSRMVRQVRALLVVSEDLVHFVVAAFLLVATAGVVLQSLDAVRLSTPAAIMLLINNALLILIIKEILWTIIRFLGRQQISIASFIFIGVISAIRRLLVIEAVSPGGEHVEPGHALEMGMTALVVFVLMLAYYVYRRAHVIPQKPQCDLCVVNDEQGEP